MNYKFLAKLMNTELWSDLQSLITNAKALQERKRLILDREEEVLTRKEHLLDREEARQIRGDPEGCKLYLVRSPSPCPSAQEG